MRNTSENNNAPLNDNDGAEDKKPLCKKCKRAVLPKTCRESGLCLSCAKQEEQDKAIKESALLGVLIVTASLAVKHGPTIIRKITPVARTILKFVR